jgi:hypothetical protein
MEGVKMNYEEVQKLENVLIEMREKTSTIRCIERYIKRIEDNKFIGVELIAENDRDNASCCDDLKFVEPGITKEVITIFIEKLKNRRDQLIKEFNNNNMFKDEFKIAQ